MYSSFNLNKVKLIVSDVDGTLLSDSGLLGNDVRKRISQLMNNGIKFSIATGRLYSAVKKFASEINLNGSIITLDGSVIIDFSDHNIIFESVINPKQVKKAISLAEKNVVNIALCHSDAIYFTENNSFIPEILDKYGARYQEVKSYDDYINNTLEIIFTSDMQESISRIRDQFEFPRSFGCNISYYRSASRPNLFFLEIRKAGSSKGKAVSRLLKHYKLKWENVAVIGDWYNDISMFETDAIKVAVANAVPEIKQKADIVTVHTNDEEGAVDFFEMILKSRKD